jgi:hypothetical protein
MLSAFSESFGGKLAESWLGTVLTPAFAFWAGGIAAYSYRYGWSSVPSWFNAQTESLQLAALVLALLGVAVSAEVVNRFDQTIVRLVEGYWPKWLKPLRDSLVARQLAKTEKAEKRFQELSRELRAAGVALDDASSQQVDEYVNLDQFLRGRPVTPNAHMATRLGNILRAAERKPLDKYGLDAVICWPRLWLLLPDETRDALVTSRQSLDSSARALAWALLFLVWAMFAWWTVPVAILAAVISHRSLLHAASNYGDLVESAFDVHRVLLYQSLRWPLPATPAEERATGQMMTVYLWRGSDQPAPTFVSKEP